MIWDLVLYFFIFLNLFGYSMDHSILFHSVIYHSVIFYFKRAKQGDTG